MEMLVQERNTRSSGMGEAIPFSINKRDFGVVTSFLSDKLYSDKLGACVREYLCNGIDSTVRSGSKRGILITMPTKFEPVLKMRDFGTGLSEEFILERYVMFGDSDKRDNPNEIGCLGLGCKAGFSYSDSFNITSWYNGVCSTYTAQKGKNWNLELFPISSSPSEEPNGIEVSIAIEEYDINSCIEKVKAFCKYCNHPFEFSEPFEIPKIDYVCRFDKFFVERKDYYHSHECKVIMGNVVYKIDLSQVKEDFRRLKDIVILADLGEVDFNISREGLEYTEKTLDFLNGTFAEILDTVKSDTQKKIDAKNHPWEVHSLIVDLNSSFNGSVSFKTKDFTFKGRAIDFTAEEVKHYLRLNTKYMRRSHKFGIDNIDENTVIVLAQEDTTIYPSRLSQGYFAKYGVWPSKILVTDDKDVYEKIFCADWLPRQVISDYKSMWAKVNRAGSAPRVIDPNTYVYENLQRYFEVKIGDVKNDKNYVVVHSSYLGPEDVNDNEFINLARQLGIKFYAIKKNKKKNLDNTWVPLKDTVLKAVENKIKNFNVNDFLIMQEIGAVGKISNAEQFVSSVGNALLTAGEKEAVEIIKNYSRLKLKGMQVEIMTLNLAKKYGKEITVKKTQDVVDQVNVVKAFCKKYELALKIYELVPCYNHWSFEELLRGYVKLVNEKI